MAVKTILIHFYSIQSQGKERICATEKGDAIGFL